MRTMRAKRARGQALVECVVAALFFLLPLLLAVSALGKLADVRHATLMAARYAAWERTVWYDDTGSPFDAINAPNRKSAARIRNEIAVRLVHDHAATARIGRADGAARGFAHGSDPVWRDHEGRAFLATYDQLSVTPARAAAASDSIGAALRGIDAVPRPPGVHGSLAPPLPADTLAVADVTFARIAADSTAYARLWPRAWSGLDFTASGAILSNTWSANGAGATARMVAASVPTAQGLGRVVDGTVGAAKKAWDPHAPDVDFGKIAPDVVPADRLRSFAAMRRP